jgi:hypothetical protein
MRVFDEQDRKHASIRTESCTRRAASPLARHAGQSAIIGRDVQPWGYRTNKRHSDHTGSDVATG